jgi:uncharacterized membrane protein (DUF2068 family)
MVDSPSQLTSAPWHHDRGLVLIAAFKFAQALLFLALGVGAHRLLHRDIADQIILLADHLRFNPESRFVNFILERVSLINDPLLRRIGVAAFCYAALGTAEGIGLYLEKAWGEFLTLGITISFLPLEIIEVIRRLTWVRVSLLAINIVVLIYLVMLLYEKNRQRRAPNAAATPSS